MTNPNLPHRLPSVATPAVDDEVREILYLAVLDESGDAFSISEADANADAMVDRIVRALTAAGYRVVQSGNPFARMLP